MLSGPIFPIERAILDGFGKVLGSDRIGLVKIRNGSGDFQDAVIGPGGQTKAIHRVFQESLSLCGYAEIIPNGFVIHLRITEHLITALYTIQQPVSCRNYSLSDIRPAFVTYMV